MLFTFHSMQVQVHHFRNGENEAMVRFSLSLIIITEPTHLRLRDSWGKEQDLATLVYRQQHCLALIISADIKISESGQERKSYIISFTVNNRVPVHLYVFIYNEFINFNSSFFQFELDGVLGKPFDHSDFLYTEAIRIPFFSLFNYRIAGSALAETWQSCYNPGSSCLPPC